MTVAAPLFPAFIYLLCDLSIFKATFVPVEPGVDKKRVTKKVRDSQQQVLVRDENAVQQDVDGVGQGDQQRQWSCATDEQQAACYELDQSHPEDDVACVVQCLHEVAEWRRFVGERVSLNAESHRHQARRYQE